MPRQIQIKTQACSVFAPSPSTTWCGVGLQTAYIVNGVWPHWLRARTRFVECGKEICLGPPAANFHQSKLSALRFRIVLNTKQSRPTTKVIKQQKMNVSSGFLCVIAIAMMAIASAVLAASEIDTENGQHPLQGQDLSLMEDDGSLDTVLLNYLFAKRLFRQLENGQDISRLLHKRNYWKQCAFNAVSCFGRRRK
ncbi:hypothetical protein CHUAL_007027 [Chamberlinius hualienensis]